MTSQVGANQMTSCANTCTVGTWSFIAATRNAATVTLYHNGQIAPLIAQGTHVNPVTSARELHVGIDDAEAAGFMDGLLWKPRIWGYDLSADSIRFIFETERDWLGV